MFNGVMVGACSRATKTALVAVGLCLVWPTAAQAGGGRLDSVRDEVRGSDSGSSGSSDDDDDDDGFFFWADDDDDTSDGSTSTASRAWANYHVPYHRGLTGGLTLARTENDLEGETPHRFSGRLWGEGAWQGRGLWRSGGGLRIDGQHFGVDGDLSYYFEPKANDALYLGTANINIIAVRVPRLVWRGGLGASTMIDGRLPGEGKRDYALGWNVTTSADIYPVYPLVLSLRLDGGRLYKAPMVRARATAGFMAWRFEIYGGYEHTQVGKVGLGGPTFGLRLWL